MKKFFFLLPLLMPTPAMAADLFSQQEKNHMMTLTLESFWGKAVDSEGKPVQPKDERERTTMPITREQANYIIDKGGESGLAQWCGVAWQGRYQLILEQQRRHMKSDVQVAYAGVLHGLAQNMLADAMKDERCDDATKKQISDLIAEDVRRITQSLDGLNQ
ncbi:MAG: hypothetical protein SFW63_03990 [Alphaproteobacteria bacterium]|nr:hypothetical protein [Alphaproteobacteria bacterium]